MRQNKKKASGSKRSNKKEESSTQLSDQFIFFSKKVFFYLFKKRMISTRNLTLLNVFFIVLSVFMVFDGFGMTGLSIINGSNFDSVITHENLIKEVVFTEKKTNPLRIRIANIDRELQEISINNKTIIPWYRYKTNKTEETIDVRFFWNSKEKYEINLNFDNFSTSTEVVSPIIKPSLEIGEVSLRRVLVNESSYNLELDIFSEEKYLDSVEMIGLVYDFSGQKEKPIRIFYDLNYYSKEMIKNIDFLVNQSRKYGIDLEKINLLDLEKHAKNFSEMVLIIVNPLNDLNDEAVKDSIPALMIDPNENQNLDDDSEGASFLNEWIRKGLVLITPDSPKPTKNLLYSNGTVITFKDDHDYRLLGVRDIQRGRGNQGELMKDNKISKSLSIEVLHSSWAPTLELLPENFKSYNYKVHLLENLPFENNKSFHTILPGYLSIEDGGWMVMRDVSHAYSKHVSFERFSKNMISLMIHEIWAYDFDEGSEQYDSVRKSFRNSEDKRLIFKDMPGEKIDSSKTLKIIAVGRSKFLDEPIIVIKKEVLDSP